MAAGKFTKERFLARILPTYSGCWIWVGDTFVAGYGRLGVNGIQVLAHRLSWELHRGPIPRGLLVMHSCDDPECVNPEHLSLGTDADNSRDKIAKGRANAPRGALAGRAKLTEGQVREMRILHKFGIRVQWLARHYCVNAGTVSHILSGKNWKHVKMEPPS